MLLGKNSICYQYLVFFSYNSFYIIMYTKEMEEKLTSFKRQAWQRVGRTTNERTKKTHVAGESKNSIILLDRLDFAKPDGL